MRALWILGVAVAATLIAMAAVGVSAAMAVDQEVVLCKLAVSLCPEGEIYPANQLFKGEATNVVFSNPNTVKCKGGSVIHGETLASMGNPLPVYIKEMSFSLCNPCNSVTSLKRPYQGTIKMDESSGAYLLSSPFAAEIACPEFKCIFESESVVLEVLNKGGVLELVANEEELTLVEGPPLLCLMTTRWSGVYKMSEPNPVSLSLFELKK